MNKDKTNIEVAEGMFLGHSISYWLELNKRPKELRVEDLLEEIAELRGKLNFIESRLSQIKKVL